MIDVVAAVITFLKAQSALTALTGTRIYGPGGVPPGATMPQQALLVLSDGISAPLSTECIEYSAQVAFHCYGATHIEAGEVYRKVNDVLHGQGPVDIDIGVGVGSGAAYDNRMLKARQINGPREDMDPLKEWPRVTAGYQIWFVRDLLTAY